LLSPTIHKFGDEFIHSGLSAVRQAHRPELFEGLSEYAKAFHLIAYVTVFANRSTKGTKWQVKTRNKYKGIIYGKKSE
jgi:hypothetical protein